MSDELLPVGQLSNKKRLVETATTAVVAELVATLAQASTAKIGALQASTEIIGYVKIDQTTPGASNAVTPVSTGGTAIKLSASGWQIAALGGGAGGAADANANTVSWFRDNAENEAYMHVRGERYNGNTWDRPRNNHSVSLLASTSRTSTGTSPDQTNYDSNAHLLMIAYDTSTGAGLTPSVQVKDSISGLYGTVWTGTAITSGSTGLYAYLLDTTITTAVSTGYTQASQVRLGRTWRLVVNPSSSGATQYSASVDNLM